MSGERKPWHDSNIWKDEKAFMQWLRSQSRRIWSRHPIKTEYKRNRRYKAPLGRVTKNNPEGMVWASDCELCGKTSRKCEVDHLDGGYGFTNWEEYVVWLKRILFVTFDDIRELCPACHAIVTHQQKTGLSFEEAKVDKARIRFEKKPVALQRKTLEAYGVVGATNKVKRAAAVRALIEMGKMKVEDI